MLLQYVKVYLTIEIKIYCCHRASGFTSPGPPKISGPALVWWRIIAHSSASSRIPPRGDLAWDPTNGRISESWSDAFEAVSFSAKDQIESNGSKTKRGLLYFHTARRWAATLFVSERERRREQRGTGWCSIPVRSDRTSLAIIGRHKNRVESCRVISMHLFYEFHICHIRKKW